MARVASARAVAEEGCYCDGAVARALETSSRADAHRRVVDAVRGACGLDVSAATRREACPLVRVSASIATTNSTASEPDADSETIGMVTFREAPYAALVSAAGEAYFAFDDGRESAVSVVAGSGGAVFAVDDVRRIDVLTLPRPTLVVEPQTGTRGVDVGENLVARYENTALPGVTFEIQPPTAADGNIVVALSRDGAATVREFADDADAEDAAEDPSAFSEVSFALAVTPEGALEARSASASTAVPLEDGEDAAAAIDTRLGLEATFEEENGRVAVALPDGVVISAAAASGSDREPTAPSPSTPPSLLETPEVGAFAGPSTGERGVVVRGGAVVRPPEGESAAEADGACAGIRRVKNFLTASLEPGAASFVVVGAVSCCEPENVTVPELVVPIKYLPRGGDARVFAPPTSPPAVECLGAFVVDARGEAVSGDLCGRVRFEARPYGVDAVFSDVRVCVDCSITGRVSDGAMFRVSHAGVDTLKAMRPVIDRLQCDVNRVEARGSASNASTPTPTSVEAKSVEAVDPLFVTRPTDERGRGRSLLQFLNPFNPFARARAFSEETEVAEYFERLAASEEETGTTPEASETGVPERNPDAESAESDAVAAEFGGEDRGGRYGLAGDGGPVPRDTDGDAYADDVDAREDGEDVEPEVEPEVDPEVDGVSSAACEDEVRRLAGDVRWWSRGAGPLEPGLPNEPYDEYVFAGSLDVLSEPRGEQEASLEAPPPPVRLAGIVLPVVFSPWVLDADSDGEWRAVQDPAAELEVACFGAATRQPDGTVVPRAGPCGGLAFAMSTFEPEGATEEGDARAPAPAALLLEVTFSGELCAGCRLVRRRARRALPRAPRARRQPGLRRAHRGRAGVRAGRPDGRAVEPVALAAAPPDDRDDPDAADDAAADASADAAPVPAAGRDGAVPQGEARNVSVCDGREGLNLKGEVLNDGNELIKGKAEDCCWECKQDPRCNVWVYCEGDCVTFAYHSCWLKRAAVADRDTPPDAWAANPDVPWTSGWFPPKREAQAPPAPGDAARETPEGETSEADAPETPQPPQPPAATPAPTIRVVPVGPRGTVQPPAPAPAVSVLPPRDDAGTPAFRAPEALGGPPPPRRPRASGASRRLPLRPRRTSRWSRASPP